MGTGSFSGVKRPGRGADHPPPFKCRGHERVGLYLCSPSVPSWPVLGWTFTYLTLFAIKCQLRYFLYAVCLLVRDYTEVKSELRTEADTKPRSDVLSQILCFENLLFAYFTRRIVPLNPCIVYPTGNFEQLQFSWHFVWTSWNCRLSTLVHLNFVLHKIRTWPLCELLRQQTLYKNSFRPIRYTGCFTTLGHNCKRWFPRSLWSKKFI